MLENPGLTSVAGLFCCWLKAPEKKSAALKVFSASLATGSWFLNSKPVAIFNFSSIFVSDYSLTLKM